MNGSHDPHTAYGCEPGACSTSGSAGVTRLSVGLYGMIRKSVALLKPHQLLTSYRRLNRGVQLEGFCQQTVLGQVN